MQPSAQTHESLRRLEGQFEGELHVDDLMRQLFATDASVYQELPLAVAFPKTEKDIGRLIQVANKTGIGLIPRTAGTSLAGQVVGSGIVVDVSRHFTSILEINQADHWVRVQPGVVRDELNLVLAEHGLLFGPETSTSNRAMIGGMLGNNSCGSNSVVYGSTRDHTLEVRGYLSDGSEATFAAVTIEEAEQRSRGNGLEASIYREMLNLLRPEEVRREISEGFPKPGIHRRNTGYAVDYLINWQDSEQETAVGDAESGRDNPDNEKDREAVAAPLDFCKLIAGSEGTLFFATEIKLNCLPLPPPVSGLQCAHFESVDDALRATSIALTHLPYAVELIDHLIVEGARRNLEQLSNVEAFVEGTPEAILITEIRGEDEETVLATTDQLEKELRQQGLGYHFPVLFGEETKKVWEVRKAGLGIVANIPGDAKPVAVIEDTAVAVEDLPAYIREFNQILDQRFGLQCVHYAHAGSGEIHLRPVLNLKTEKGQQDFRRIAAEIATLVKKYRGSLSGEHGDGRLRAEFLKEMIGEKNFQLLRQVKRIWDPNGVFNPGKIVDAPPMDQSLRYEAGQATAELKTVFDFSAEQGLQRAAEMCNGTAACRKTHLAGGTMCPSYMATRNEKDTTRARANLLRRVLTEPKNPDQPLNDRDLYNVMDLCLSCKGCKAECPTNVDVGKMKAEFLQAYQDANGVPRRSKLIANFSKQMKLASKVPWFYNWLSQSKLTSGLVKGYAGFASNRSLPKLHRHTLRSWFRRHQVHPAAGIHGNVILFCDEFTNYNDVETGIATVELIERLGFAVDMPEHDESGRAAMSKGLLRKARDHAERNVEGLSSIVSSETPLLGIEPSAILSFRDEYPVLVREEFRDRAIELAANTKMIDEWVETLIDRGLVTPGQFLDQPQTIRLHGHCHQKALASLKPTVKMLQLPTNFRVRLIPSGCCGMAGSFGYEKEHFDLSMQIGELVLFPTVRDEPRENLIAAPGTSCRHQILDGTGIEAWHPVQILRRAMRES